MLQLSVLHIVQIDLSLDVIFRKEKWYFQHRTGQNVFPCLIFVHSVTFCAGAYHVLASLGVSHPLHGMHPSNICEKQS